MEADSRILSYCHAVKCRASEILILNPDTDVFIAEHFGGVRTVIQGFTQQQLFAGSTKNCILSGSFELEFSDVVLGHTSEVWALAAHPSLQQFVTAGWDSILQLWDSASRTVVWRKDIGVVRFSPNSEMLALGSRDNNIYIYQLGADAGKYSRIGQCTGHSSFITHLDWSMDSQYLRSNSGDYEVLYSLELLYKKKLSFIFYYEGSPTVCEQITQPSKMRDVEWASQTCTLSFTSVGAWPEGADGTDVNASAAAGGLLATGDDWGKVKLYSWPTIQPKVTYFFIK
ncbi:unnamed protein product [Nezara viridula]|uniref:EML-like second beta-propeller domain-containing protein n=1 Tax=Nezara viridula TaxID=85310 RepID=A0A9P0E6U5_NEZVI|nr:unnamed protein product [Nezara viridula]